MNNYDILFIYLEGGARVFHTTITKLIHMC